nr:MAG TPA: hypothetical protein [Caudoviricetes sp.]
MAALIDAPIVSYLIFEIKALIFSEVNPFISIISNWCISEKISASLSSVKVSLNLSNGGKSINSPPSKLSIPRWEGKDNRR